LTTVPSDEPQRSTFEAGRPQSANSMEEVLFELRRFIVGQDRLLERLLVALLARGHVLLEGVPGLAKTATVKALAQVVGGSFGRIQFTPDLVPADVVGTRIYTGAAGLFSTELGPVFANLVLADEINRASAKVQSALLEVMQEHQVTIGKETFAVPEPFLVLATQNPIESDGTYLLPEAQLDRFMFKVLVDYPSYDEELVVVQRVTGPRIELRMLLTPSRLVDLQQRVDQVYVDPREMGLPDIGLVTFEDPETGAQLTVNTGDQRLRERFAAAAAAQTSHIDAILAGCGVDELVLDTDRALLPVLAGFLEARRGRRAQRGGTPPGQPVAPELSWRARR
jgi:MoxR-like ATPase